MARQNLGARPSRPNDYVDVEWVTSTYPSLASYVSSGVDIVISLPEDPVDHTMLIVEVEARANITVSLPENVLLTIGTQPVAAIYSGKTGFFGLRYSANAGAWFLLSTTAQV